MHLELARAGERRCGQEKEVELSDQRRDVLCPKRRDAKEWDANDGTTSDAPRMMDARNYPDRKSVV